MRHVVSRPRLRVWTVVRDLGPTRPLELDDSPSLWIDLGELDPLGIVQSCFLECHFACGVEILGMCQLASEPKSVYRRRRTPVERQQVRASSDPDRIGAEPPPMLR